MRTVRFLAVGWPVADYRLMAGCSGYAPSLPLLPSRRSRPGPATPSTSDRVDVAFTRLGPGRCHIDPVAGHTSLRLARRGRLLGRLGHPRQPVTPPPAGRVRAGGLRRVTKPGHELDHTGYFGMLT